MGAISRVASDKAARNKGVTGPEVKNLFLSPLTQVSRGSFARSSLAELVLILSHACVTASDSLSGRLTERGVLAI